MKKTTTIDKIQKALNPLPAKLMAKGKKNPSVEFRIEANARMCICLSYAKQGNVSDWDKEYHHFFEDTFDLALSKAIAFIGELPSAEQAKLHHFMGQLGKLIDAGKSAGIEVDYMNPLVATMKRLSENVITHQKSR